MGTKTSTTRLNRSGLENAEALIQRGRFAYDERDDWSEHQLSSELAGQRKYSDIER